MAKAAVVVLADTEARGDVGRLANALATAREFKEAGDEVVLLFDGAGTKWIGVLAAGDHEYSGAYERVSDVVAGACSYCAGAYGVTAQVERAGVELLDESDGHPSIRRIVADGYQVITF